MLKKLAIFTFVLFCIVVELAFAINHLSLRKKVTAVFSSEVEVLDTTIGIEQKELTITQDDIKSSEEGLTSVNNSETVEEEAKEVSNEIVEKEVAKDVEIKVEEKKVETKSSKPEEKIVNTGIQEKSNVKKEVSKNETPEIRKVEENKVVTTEKSNNTKTSNEVTTKYPDNCLIIGSNVIQVKIAPATQKNVNSYDVVQDNRDVSSYDNIVLFGHNYNSFKCLKSVKVGQKLKLSNSGKIVEYVVFRSERGRNSSDGTEIYSEQDGKELVYTYHGYNEVLKLITCDGNQRWVVSAYKSV